ncbi:MAG: 1-acyl-sn-glycerol-3-phosphate acyltransferase [Bdellovibrionales bacterium]|nr:1-acyl-sn-glycerol-3-phosphate acyltransferase [Bdellovibrionales bacterium]
MRRLFAVSGFVASTALCGLIITPISLLPDRQRYRWSGRVLQLWAKFVLGLFRIRIHERPASDAVAHSPRVIIANHVSYLDIPVLLSRGPCVFIAKHEVSQWPLLGWVARRAGVVFVKRGKLWSRASALLHLQSRLQLGLDIVIFPEGSTSIDGPRRRSANFFSGAFRIARMESAPVESVYIDYTDVERCAWLDDQDFAPHVWRLYSPKGTRVSLRSEVITAVTTRAEQREALAFCRSWLLEGGRNFNLVSKPQNRWA